jgi:hypothetical protein
MTRSRNSLQPSPTEADDIVRAWQRAGRPLDADAIARETGTEPRRIVAAIDRVTRPSVRRRAVVGIVPLEAVCRQIGGSPRIVDVAARLGATEEQVRETIARISGQQIAEVTADGRIEVLVPAHSITGWDALARRRAHRAEEAARKRRARRLARGGVDAAARVPEGVAHD